MSVNHDRRKLGRAVQKYVDASIAMSWIGMQHPDDREGIKRDFKIAKEKYKKVIEELLPVGEKK